MSDKHCKRSDSGPIKTMKIIFISKAGGEGKIKNEKNQEKSCSEWEEKEK